MPRNDAYLPHNVLTRGARRSFMVREIQRHFSEIQRYNERSGLKTDNTMIDSKLIDDITSKLAKLMPADLGVLKNDFENNARATLQGIFEKLDLVTREEFDVQADLLARTQEKIKALEEQIKALEEKQG